MAIQITGIRFSGGTEHEHIQRVWWTDSSTGTSGDSSPAEIVSKIDTGGETAYVDNGGEMVSVGVVEPDGGCKHLRTHADGIWSDHLLSLPQE